MTKQKRALVPTPTKGKGGGKGGGGGKSETIDLKDCPLELKTFPIPDSPPKYVDVMERDGDSVGMEDLDSLQLELESLLSSVVVRRRYLKEEADILQNIDKYKGKNKKGPGSPGKRHLGRDDKSVKKLKLQSGKPLDVVGGGGGGKGGKPKSQEALGGGGNGGIPTDPLANEQIKPPAPETPKSQLPKNETPGRFWAFVEPYCAPIQLEDVKFLEDLIKGYSDMGEYFRVPPLGQHYSIRWAKEDLENEKAKSSEGGKADSSNSSSKEEPGSKPAKKETKPDTSPFGELTQRLIQGLMEENAQTVVEESGQERSATEPCGSRNSFIQSLKVAGADSLEKRIKKELEAQGILDPEEDKEGGAEQQPQHDEILAELERCQAELRAVSNHNLSQLRRLVKAAREEMARQEVRNKLAEADAEVCEAYKKIALARARKKSPTKKEKDTAWKALKDREAILKQLEQI